MLVCLVGCVGCDGHTPSLDWSDEQIVSEFERLHRPVSDVYGLSGWLSTESLGEDLWTLLSRTFAGEALTAEYLEHFVTLVGMGRDGTRIRIASLDYDSVEVLERFGEIVRVSADWSVGGLITHRSHTHPRINSYRAVFDLAPALDPPGEMRIVSSQILDLARQERLRPQNSPGGSARGSLSMGDLIESGLAQEILESSEAAGAASGKQ